MNFLFVLSNQYLFAQNSDVIQKNNLSYDKNTGKYFNPNQIDFSKKYLDILLSSNSHNELDKYYLYNCDSIWQTQNFQQNGIIGKNYQRIQFHIDNALKSNENSDLYYITGKSKVNNNICNFSGTIELLKLYCYECDFDSTTTCGYLIGQYVFYEDSTQNHSGIFKGIMSCDIYIDKKNKRILLDESMDVADGYQNRTYVGVWVDYHTKLSKKCIWGDYRLPFTFDFDCGDGEMIVCEKYVKNGWETYNDYSEYSISEDKTVYLKNKWWIRPN